jgi:hypothetical protein
MRHATWPRSGGDVSMTPFRFLTLCDYPETLSVICQVSPDVIAVERQLNTPLLVHTREAILI